LTPVGKRQAMIEKVSTDILNTIRRFGSVPETPRRIAEDIGMSSHNESPVNEKHETTFVFNAIDSVNQKTRNTLPVEDSGFLIQKLEQLARSSGNKKRNLGADQLGELSPKDIAEGNALS